MEYASVVVALIFCFATAEKDQPRMLSTSSNLRVTTGSSVLLPCHALNIGETDVRVWTQLPSRTLFSGSISVSSDPSISLLDRSSLHIVNITQQYSGEYLCNFFSKPHLKVLHKILVLVPPSISADPSHGKVIEQRGSPAKMICNATGVPKPTVTWTYERNGTQVNILPSGVRQVEESKLLVESVDNHQAGHYRCIADNEVGNAAVVNFNLTVLSAPEVSVSPDWLHGDEGSTVEFTCSCKSTPISQLLWMRGDPKLGRHLPSDERIKIKEVVSSPAMVQSWLKIQRMRREYLGSYACVCKNAVGQTWKLFEVSGLAEPIQLRGSASGGESYLLQWTAKSYSPIIEFQMKVRKYKDGDQWTDVMIPVEANNHQTIFYSQSYNVTGLDPDQRYEVVIQAHNDFGWNRPSTSFFIGAGEEEMAENEDLLDIMLTTLPLYEADFANSDTHLSRGSLTSTYALPLVCALVRIAVCGIAIY